MCNTDVLKSKWIDRTMAFLLGLAVGLLLIPVF